MRETGFIRQNKEKWEKFEEILKQQDKDPDQLSELFTQITDDLSYSRTFYPNRSVRVYLNNISQKVFHNIYKNKKERAKKLIFFWKEEMPLIMWETRRQFLISFLIFGFAVLIGAFSSYHNPEFPRAILGDSYMNMTIENIENGDPMAVYKQQNELEMTLRITVNNIRVAFLTFCMGILYCIGTVVILIENGIMLGAFQWFFIDKGLMWESLLTVWMHGTLEISAIIIAGGAGLTLGSGLIFPGTLTRIQSLQNSARKAIKIMLGLVPIFMMAGFIEGFLTRYTEAPALLRGLFILASLAFIIGYYVVYPFLKKRSGFKAKIQLPQFHEVAPPVFDTQLVKNNGEVFAESIVFLKNTIGFLIKPILLISLIVALASTLLFNYEFKQQFNLSPGLFEVVINTFLYIGDTFQLMDYQQFPFLSLINFFSTILILGTAGYLLKGAAKDQMFVKRFLWKEFFGFFIKNSLSLLVISGLIHGLLFINFGLGLLLLIILPFLFLLLAVAVLEEKSIFSVLGYYGKILGAAGGRVLGLYLIFILISFVFLFIMASPLVWWFFDFFQVFLNLNEDNYQLFFNFFFSFTAYLSLFVIISGIFSGVGIGYFSFKEIRSAEALKDKISRFGEIRKNYANTNG